jgi:glycosyltransferase involved in cell wall biosynthesis
MIEHGMRPDKFVHIPNGIDTAGWDGKPEPLPNEHARLFSKLHAEKRFIVCYAGAHGLANALDVLLDAAMELRNHPVSIVLIGKGPEKEKLEERVARNGLVHVHFLDEVHRKAVLTALAAADVLYIGLQGRPLFRYGVSPNKLIDYMMAAKPIISAITAGNDMVTESGCGISVPAENPSAISAAVLTLLALTHRERAAMGLRGREYVLRNNAYEVLANRFERVMMNCRVQESAAGRRPV